MLKILVYGYGNPGRRDDALGVEFVEKLEKLSAEVGTEHLHFDCNYQLNIEDAVDLPEYDLVVFADATTEDIPDFRVSRIEPSPETEFTMHAVSPAFVLDVCRRFYGPPPPAYLIHIKGYEWDLREGCTAEAKRNLERSAEHVWNVISDPCKSLFEMDSGLINLKKITIT